MSIRLKTILGVALIEAVLLLTLISMTLNYLKTSNYDALVKRAETTATLFSSSTKDAAISYDLASLQSFTEEFISIPDIVYVRILDARGRVFAEAGDDARLTASFQLDTLPEEVHDGVYDQFIEVTEGGTSFARIEFGIDINAITQVLDEATKRSTFVAIIEMALVALFSFLLGTYLTRQLWVLFHGAKQISKGNLAVDIPVNGRDEVAEVSRAFNSMVRNLREASRKREEYEQELLELNQSLEDRVEKRTQQLRSKNADLEAANKQIKQTQAQLLSSEKLASVGLLAAGVAHEINNPMSFIMSNMRTLQHYVENYLTVLEAYQKLAAAEDPKQRQQLLEQIQQLSENLDLEFQNEDVVELLDDSIEGAVRVRDIVAGLKDFSRVDSADEYLLFDINECIQSTLKVSANEIKYHCELVTELGELPQTYCLPSQLNQVFLNLLVNASHAIKDKGVITIRSKVIDDKILVEIEDTGSGIEADIVANIFDPFYTTKSIGEGTGLGLSISYGIIEDHGGHIEVESEVGKGSCFKVWLPVRTEKPQQQTQEVEQASELKS